MPLLLTSVLNRSADSTQFKFMKHVYFTILSILIITGSVSAQNAFDKKKRKNIPVNTSSLHAKKITAPSFNATGRVGSNVFQQSRHLTVQQLSHRILHSKGKLPVFIQSSRNAISSHSLKVDPSSACYQYLQELEPLLGINNSSTIFSIQAIRQERNFNSHLRLQQLYKGLPVYGAEIAIHLNANGQGEAFNGKYALIENDIDITPAVNENQAVNKVRQDIVKGSLSRPLSAIERKYVQHAEPSTTLCIYEDNSLVKSYLLAYHIVYSPSIHQRWEYFINAQNGNVIRRFNSICMVDGPKTATANDLNGTSRTINTYQQGANFFMLDASRSMFDAATSTLPDEPVGGILTIDMSNTFGDNSVFTHVTTTTNAWNTANHAKAVSAHFNAGEAYQYFLQNHGRSSINGSGGSIISIINVSNPENGQAMDNAFWNGQAMFYGNGSTDFDPLAGSMDVAGHEMTHGVVENTAKLEYNGESGAINESMADIFGSMMDPEDWTIGEDIVKAGAFPSGALRSLENPHNGGASLGDPGFQPSHMNEKYTGSQDNGGVHINSGIPNHAFFKYAEAITREKAADVFYRALDLYLTKSSQFIDLRLAVIKAAGDLFGTSSNEAVQAGVAFDAVGITGSQGGDYVDDLPGNPGSEHILLYSTDPDDANSLYRATADLSTVTAISTTIFLSKPSVTDDGSVAVFVAGDNTIRAIVTQPGEDPEEFTLQEEQIWSNVAISKGGNRLAAVTEAWDNTIYVYDFESETWGEFELYNPTYSGVNSGGTVYADALEWDYSGEFLVYDAFNQIKNSNGQDIEYWDVNFIRAWDLAASDFGDGTISKLFSSLPEGVSIGNPAFAKLSPHILAFDMVDELNGEYSVLGCNIETGATDIILSNETLGYPSFNKNDSRVALTLASGDQYYTGYVNLNADKISSPNTSATGIFDFTMWPVYFSAGDRDIGEVTSVLPESKAVKLSCYPNPFTSELRIVLDESFAGKARAVEVTNVMGQTLAGFVTHQAGSEIAIKFSDVPQGNYIVRIQNGKKTGVCRAVKFKN
jgi:bacillolysin